MSPAREPIIAQVALSTLTGSAVLLEPVTDLPLEIRQYGVISPPLCLSKTHLEVFIHQLNHLASQALCSV